VGYLGSGSTGSPPLVDSTTPLFSEEFPLASILDQPSDRAPRKTLRTRANYQHVFAFVDLAATTLSPGCG